MKVVLLQGRSGLVGGLAVGGIVRNKRRGRIS